MEQNNNNQGQYVTPNIVLCSDGKYRWEYDLNLFTNPSIFFLIWTIFFFIFIVIFAFVFISDAINWGIDAEMLLKNLKFFAFFIIGMTAVSGLGYLLYAAIMGGKYCVGFEMDENGINHRQMPVQAKKAKKIAAATMLVGIATGKPTTVGVGMNAARTEMYTEFARVKSVKAYPSRHLIKVNTTLSHNQVYAKKEDFEFVKNYISAHCEM